MKTYKNLYAKVWEWQNLYLAYSKARRGKRSRHPVAAFEYDQEENLIRLQKELQAQTYQPGAYHSFYIHEPKRRLISAAPFRDRVVHHALCNIIEPIFERSFVFDSYANRQGKGSHKAIDRAQQYARNYKYVLQLDVRQFFPSIDHQILRQILQRKLADSQLLGLIDLILDSGVGVLAEQYQMHYFPGDDLFAVTRPRGLPIGNLTSQFWANCYLNPLDHFVKRDLKCTAYVRYVDDLLLFAEEKETLWQWQQAVIKKMAELRLTIHPGAHPRPVTEGFPFLGFTVYPTHRRLKRRKGIYFQRKLKKQLSLYRAGEIEAKKLNASIQGWINHVRYGDTWGLRRAVLKHVVL
ncbi:MAG: reverse transcriptase domain-containing protein, partial [Candidatus Promineifilaceae bacterium]|nr:RNA-dependent DNA polymerase [Anaerolineaceae bacterium]